MLNRLSGTGRTLRGLVFDVERIAIHDGPGIRTTVCLKGCPLRCWWCHSPESQLGRPQLLYMPARCTACGLCLEVCPMGGLRLGTAAVEVDWSICTHCGACAAVCYPGALKLAGEWMTVDEVVREVEQDVGFFEASGGGVTLTGGEAAQQGSFTYEVLRACRERGIHTAIETAGLAPWPVYARLAEVTDLFLYDLKQMDSARHRQLTGLPNRLIHDNLRRLAAGARRTNGAADPCCGDAHGAVGGDGYEVVVRVPCIPELTDGEDNIRAIAAFVSELGLGTIHLLPYNASAAAKYEWIGRPYRLADLATQSAEQMQRLADLCAAHGLAAQVGG